tara:strand:- start:74438 stop:76093 length:1656 start_codon:yes stop_codon:yes gene_type:complete
MALQVRRGTNAERLGITPAEGELIYVTDTKQLYVGDGSTQGGTTTIANTIDSVLADTSPQLGGNLDLNNFNINGTGSIDITGTITASGTVNLGDGVGSDILVIGGAIQGHLVPDVDATHNLGSPSKYWNEAWFNQLNIDSQITAERVQADLIADDSTVVFNSATGQIAAAQISGTMTGDVVGNITSAGTSAFSGTLNLNGATVQNAAFNLTGDLTGNVVGNTTGYHTGDVKGSVFADDSAMILDGENGIVVADVNSNTVTVTTLNINGNATATGNIAANQISGTATAQDQTVVSAAGYYDNADGHYLGISRARGTKASPTDLQLGDNIGAIVWGELSKNVSAAQISVDVDPNGTLGASVVPGLMRFIVNNNAGVPLTRATIDYTGTFTTFGVLNGRTTAPTGIPFYSLANSNVVSDGPRFLMRRSRGTYDTPLAVQNNDVLHRVVFGGHDGTNYVDGAFITAEADGTIATGIVPTQLAIKTMDGSGVVNTAITVKADAAEVQFGGAIKLATYADDATRDAAITSPTAGMMIFNTTGTKFQGYTGAAWVDLN